MVNQPNFHWMLKRDVTGKNIFHLFNHQGGLRDQENLSNDKTTTSTWRHFHLQHMQPPPFMLSFSYTHFPSTFHAHTHPSSSFPHTFNLISHVHDFLCLATSIFLSFIYIPSYLFSNPFDSPIHLTHIPIIFNYPLFHA